MKQRVIMEKVLFKDMVRSLAKDGKSIAEELAPSSAFIAIMFQEQFGKLLDAVKKVSICNKPIDLENLAQAQIKNN